MAVSTPTTPTPWHINLAIGFIAGTGEVVANHPFWALNTRQQTKLPFTLNPFVLYRGLGIHSLSSVPSDMIQISTARFVSERLPYPSDVNRLIGGAIGGATGAILIGPAERIMTRQQAEGLRTFPMIRAIIAQHGLRGILSGFTPTMGREGLVCLGFFAAVPIVKKRLLDHGLHEVPATLAAGVGVGIVTSAVSQPCDTIKARVQVEPSLVKPSVVARQILQQRGRLGFFDGLTYRMARVTSAVFLLGTLNEYLEKIFIPSRSHL